MNWLLLRGLTREQRHWGEFLPKFKDMFGEDKVFCLDHVGVGTESGRKMPCSVTGMTDDLRNRWLELKSSVKNKDESWGIVSLSLGSMVSMDWCGRFAEDFRFQVLMNSSSRSDSPPWKRLLPENLARFARISKTQSAVERELEVLEMCTNLLSEQKKQSYAEQWAEFALDQGAMRRVVLAQGLAAVGFKRPDKMDVATLALVSAADRLVDPSCMTNVARALKFSLEVHPGAGHELSLDDPDWVVERIQETLQTLEGY